MAIDTMKKGSIEMLTLFLLCEEDAYGYQLVQKIKEQSKAKVSLQCRRAHFIRFCTAWRMTGTSPARRS